MPKGMECTLKSINVRTEKHGDDEVLAVDLGFEVTLSRKLIRKYLCTEIDWWLDDTDQTPRGSISKVISSYEHSNVRADLRDVLGRDEDMIRCAPAKLNSFKMTPKHHGVAETTFRLQVSGVSEERIGELSGLLHSTVWVDIAERKEATEEPTESQPSLPGTGMADSGNGEAV
ncbi:MAG: hypothetical protein V2J24_23690 [Pseudomonadales bacterium]|jgi:hypothetical protein|nr:hypothetical protein [Pseudomonadales bacterium]